VPNLPADWKYPERGERVVQARVNYGDIRVVKDFDAMTNAVIIENLERMATLFEGDGNANGERFVRAVAKRIAELERERDAALTEARDMQVRLQRVVDGSKAAIAERDFYRRQFPTAARNYQKVVETDAGAVTG